MEDWVVGTYLTQQKETTELVLVSEDAIELRKESQASTDDKLMFDDPKNALGALVDYVENDLMEGTDVVWNDLSFAIEYWREYIDANTTEREFVALQTLGNGLAELNALKKDRNQPESLEMDLFDLAKKTEVDNFRDYLKLLDYCSYRILKSVRLGQDQSFIKSVRSIFWEPRTSASYEWDVADRLDDWSKGVKAYSKDYLKRREKITTKER